MPDSLLLSKTHPLCFDDVLLEPQYSEIKSRQDVDLTSVLSTDINLKIPIIAANMDTVTELTMWQAITEIGGYAYIHRFMPKEKRIAIAEHHTFPAMSIGVGEEELNLAKAFLDVGCASLCLDIAHADSKHALEQIEKLSNWISENIEGTVAICAGNVVTQEGAERLLSAGANIIKVGVGPGSRCQTRTVTGHGYPQLSAIAQVAMLKHVYNFKIIADGGIRYSGDIVKALAAGADAVMLGSLLAGCHETPSPTRTDSNGNSFKQFRGMASIEAQKARGKDYRIRTPEGISSEVPVIGSVKEVVLDLAEGVKSGLSYSGSSSIEELQEKAKFVVVTHASIMESLPRL